MRKEGRAQLGRGDGRGVTSRTGTGVLAAAGALTLRDPTVMPTRLKATHQLLDLSVVRVNRHLARPGVSYRIYTSSWLTYLRNSRRERFEKTILSLLSAASGWRTHLSQLSWPAASAMRNSGCARRRGARSGSARLGHAGLGERQPMPDMGDAAVGGLGEDTGWRTSSAAWQIAAPSLNCRDLLPPPPPCHSLIPQRRRRTNSMRPAVSSCPVPPPFPSPPLPLCPPPPPSPSSPSRRLPLNTRSAHTKSSARPS